MKKSEEIAKKLLSMAGITINGSKDADIKIMHPDFYKCVLANGSIGLGESYMEGWWEVKNLDQFFYRILNASLDEQVKNWNLLMDHWRAKFINYGRKSKAFEVGKKHYDLGNLLFRKMLDKRMVYSCGYWKTAQNLDQAQEAKLDLICQKLDLKPGMKVLDIGCGWGSFGKYAAKKYGVQVIGITVSKEQAELGTRLCKGLDVKIFLQDYRQLDASVLLGKGKLFDRVVSIGMIEHVGYKNYRRYMEVVYGLLSEEGMFLLHTIGGNRSMITVDPWTRKYIFTNSMIPSIAQLGSAVEDLFVMEDWHNFGNDYDKTLIAWYNNFDQAWDELKSVYDERFFRMWKYYLLSCAGSFRARKNQLWQIVLSKNGVQNGYSSIR